MTHIYIIMYLEKYILKLYLQKDAIYDNMQMDIT